MESAKNRAAQLLSRAFDGGVVEHRGEDRAGAELLRVRGLNGSWDFRVFWAGEGWPGDLNAVLQRLPRGKPPADALFAARDFSPGAISMLAELGASWADELGNARIHGHGLLVLRDADRVEPARPRFSWSASALAVAEALLSRDWPDGVRTSEVATLIDWSPPQVSQILQGFDRKGWTVKFGPQRGPNARREVQDTDALLDAWSSEIAAGDREARFAHRVIRSPLEFLRGEMKEVLDQAVRWSLSGWAAAHELAPLTDAVPSLQIYVHEDDFGKPLFDALDRLGLTDVAEGGRVAFFPAPASVLALSQPGGIGPIASTPRVYADLLSLGGRATDAAAHLREELIDRPVPTQGEGSPPIGLLDWERECRQRLAGLARRRREWEAAYEHGAWSASYRLIGLTETPPLRQVPGLLREVAGRETGWPAWWAPKGGDERPRSVDGAIECWLSGMMASDPSEADYWRADPKGRLCLIRPYQEDYEFETDPGTTFDLVLPIWRTGECLRHAERLARRLDSNGIQLMMRWTGLRGRHLASLSDKRRRLGGDYRCTEAEVVAYVETRPDEVRDDLVACVRGLLDPLYGAFDLFEPERGLYEAELAKLVSHADG